MKKENLTLLSLLFCTAAFSQAPSIEWQKTLGGTGNELIYSVHETSDGGYIAAGQTESNDGDISGNNGNEDALVIRFASDGSVVWKKTYGGSASENAESIFQTADGGYIFAGSTASSNGDVSSGKGGEDVWVVKLDENGIIEWENTYGGTSGDAAFSIVASSGGGYIVGGQSRSNDGDLTENNGMLDFWVFKIDSNGGLVWQHSLGGSEADYSRGLIETSTGEIVVVGYSTSNDGDLTENHGGDDGWIVKLSGNGSIIWQTSIGGSLDEQIFDVIENSAGKFVLTGASLSSDADVSENKGGIDCWVVQMSEQGTIEWEHTFGGSGYEEGYQISETAADHYIVVGSTTSSDGDVSINKGEIDAWLFAMNASGAVLWEKTAGSSSWDSALSGKATTDGGFIIAGYAGTADGDITETKGLSDTWIVKLKREDLGITQLENDGITLFPNATNGMFVIQSDALIDHVTVYNILGEIVATAASQSSTTISVDITALSEGNYLVEIITGSQKTTKTIVKR